MLDASRFPHQCPSDGIATENNIIARLNELKAEVQPGEEFVFAESSHGSCVAGGAFATDDEMPQAAGEPDGKITGAELAQYLSGFQKGVTMTVILDSCYSGNFLNGDALVGPCATNLCPTAPPIAIKDSDGQPMDAANLSILTCADQVTTCLSIAPGPDPKS